VKNIKAIIFDVDGTLTDGKIHTSPTGELFKSFCTLDAGGIIYAKSAGISVFFITGRKSNSTTYRAKELKIDKVYVGIARKTTALIDICDRFKIKMSEMCYVGDDLNDLAAMVKCGYSIAVANAVPEIKEVANYVTNLSGGYGAGREAVEHVLKNQDKWETIVKYYRESG